MKALTREVHCGFFTMVVRSIQGRSHPDEFMIAPDSVNVLIYDRSSRRVVLVRQRREAMDPDFDTDGLVTETVAGRLHGADAKLSAISLAKKEASEEAEVPIADDQVQLLNDGVPLALSAGAITERAYLAVAEVPLGRLTTKKAGLGTDADENITRLVLTFEEFADYICEDLRVFAFQQWLMRTYPEEFTKLG